MHLIYLELPIYLENLKSKKQWGPDRGSNPEPLAPKARIIPLDHQALSQCDFMIIFIHFLTINYCLSCCNFLFVDYSVLSNH